MNEFSLPFPVGEDWREESGDRTRPVRRSGGGELRWEIVARMPGFAAATIVASRLKVEDIPVRVWQEAAGQALGLLVGSLGTGYVAVPETYTARARAILADAAPFATEEE